MIRMVHSIIVPKLIPGQAAWILDEEGDLIGVIDGWSFYGEEAKSNKEYQYKNFKT
ncbi:hypothetical protein [Paenibacillus woosongensis]|uniref:Uncharacterized protein n=1 Tax=Paenibacillus woosongensis TaxID=307580 RepID=A0A7X2Z3Z3_9BACL|nr:hypothetical protein [Paenibacillus woosongensis]MUG46324.1 hypothetical protein [Paenibacillus woosongensis]